MSSSQAKRLAGKTILVTGASSGIGKSTALEFARTQPDDLKLILTARREDALHEVKKEIEGFAKGVKVHVVKLDVSNVDEIGQFVGNLPGEFKEIDVLVNNAYVDTTYHTSVQLLEKFKLIHTIEASSKASPKPPKSPPQTSTPCSKPT
jgi:NADP-dependent 3-hydroxy acid dehydrogenase YdfG